MSPESEPSTSPPGANPLDVMPRPMREVLETFLENRAFRAGTRILREGDPGDGCYFIRQGTVRVELEDHHTHGNLVLGHLTAGGMVGEMSLMGMPLRSASVYAETDVSMGWLSSDSYAILESSQPQTAMMLSRIFARDISQKVHQTNERLLSYISIESTAAEASAAVERALANRSPFAAPWTGEFLAGIPSDTAIVDAFLAAGINTFCLVADSVFSTMDEYLTDLAAAGRVNRWVVPSERSIPAVATGRWLATGKLTVMSMQNSGFSNAMDYLRTVMLVHKVPGIVISSWRGFDATLDDSEPHILVGDATDTDNRNTMGDTHVFGTRSGFGLMRELHRALEDALRGNLSCLRISPPGFARRYPLKRVGREQVRDMAMGHYRRMIAEKGRPFEAVQQDAPVSREDALRKIHSMMMHRDPFYIVGNGFNARAMQALRLTDATFENAGGMGSSLAIAWGAAKSDPSRVFVAIDGDQNAQMNEMEKVLSSDYPENLFWFILNNGTGESVGSSLSLPLSPWHYELAHVINTSNEAPGSFKHARINASGLKFSSPEALALARELGSLPAQAHLGRSLIRTRSQTARPAD